MQSASLGNKELTRLARKLSANDVTLIALQLLDFEPANLDNIKYDRGDAAELYNFEVLHRWKKKNPTNNRQVTSFLLTCVALVHLVHTVHFPV